MRISDHNLNAGHKRRAFTLIELLTVIAIIGILAAILIPTVGAVRVSANKAKTKAQFGQWIAATEMFRQEYGFYPRLTSGASGTDGLVDTDVFLANLTARNYSGTKLTTTALINNRKGISFYSVSTDDLSDTTYGDSASNKLIDAFRNMEIGVKIDWDLDGRITDSTVAVKSADGGSLAVISNLNIRAGVIFYSAGKGAAAGQTVKESDAVKTWE